MFVSIIIPSYNSSNTILRCLDSIKNQDFFDYEIIIIDDGSTDNTKDIINNFINNNPSIQIIYKYIENSGPSIARNIGKKIANGKYIWFVDSDDEIDRDSLSILFDRTRLSNCDIVRFSYKTIKNTLESRKIMDLDIGVFKVESLFKIQYYTIFYSWEKSLNCWKHIYSKELIDNIDFIEDKYPYSEDILFNCLVYPKAKSIQIIPDLLYKYHIQSTSLSHKKRHTLEKIINSYVIIRNKYKEWDIWEKFEPAIISSYGDFMLLGGGRRQYGAIYTEYKSYDDIKEAHRNIQEIVYSNDFQDLVINALKRDIPSELKNLYELLAQKETMEVYKTISYSSKNNELIYCHDKNDIVFIQDLEIITIDNEKIALPVGENKQSFVLNLNDESANALKLLIETKKIDQTINLLSKTYPNENEDEIKEVLLDFITELRSLKIIE